MADISGHSTRAPDKATLQLAMNHYVTSNQGITVTLAAGRLLNSG
ncbi:hypothetical protein EKH55_4011 [Sinorhizobium alkalisoli]|nr:hypothetical protein EKH55_4011 [Sinorhizobium alkalisoli]